MKVSSKILCVCHQWAIISAAVRHLHGMRGCSVATIAGVGCNIRGRVGCNMLQPTPTAWG